MKKRIAAFVLAVLMLLSGLACAVCAEQPEEKEYCLHENSEWIPASPGTLFINSRYKRVCPDCGFEQTAKKARTSLAAILFDRIAGLFFLFDNPTLSDNFTVTAHTGPGELPMNSMISLRYSLQSGADIVEFDLDLKSDGVAVMSHGEADKAKATLEDGFALVAKYTDIRVNVDVKNRAAVEQAQVLAIRYGILDRIFYTGVGEWDVEYVREHSPLVPYYLNVSPSSDPDECAALCEKAVSMGAIGLNFSYNGYSDEIAAAARERGLLISLYTVNSAKDMRMCLKYDVDNITTEFPYKLYTMTGTAK